MLNEINRVCQNGYMQRIRWSSGRSRTPASSATTLNINFRDIQQLRPTNREFRDQATCLVGIDSTKIGHVAWMLFGLVSKQHPLYANQSVQSHVAKTGPRFLIPQRLLQPRNLELRYRHGSTLDSTDSPTSCRPKRNSRENQ